MAAVLFRAVQGATIHPRVRRRVTRRSTLGDVSSPEKQHRRANKAAVPAVVPRCHYQAQRSQKPDP